MHGGHALSNDKALVDKFVDLNRRWCGRKIVGCSRYVRDLCGTQVSFYYKTSVFGVFWMAFLLLEKTWLPNRQKRASFLV